MAESENRDEESPFGDKSALALATYRSPDVFSWFQLRFPKSVFLNDLPSLKSTTIFPTPALFGISFRLRKI
jgi:hypothetical protein